MIQQAMDQYNTLADAKQIDPTIRLDDVKQFVETYVEQKTQVHGASNCVPKW